MADGEQRHLVLVGMMGVGKTSVGRKVARRLDRPFVDGDEALLARTGHSVAEWFAAEGEGGFRREERGVLEAMLDISGPIVLATGGGVVLDPANRALLSTGPLVIWLAAGPAFLASRVSQRAHRPLLADGDPAPTLAGLAAERDPLYREVADVIIDVEPAHSEEGKPKSTLADLVVDAVAGHGVAPPPSRAPA